MNEFSFIQAIKQKHYRQESLQRGIGDDAAVFRELTNDTVVAVDTFVEGIHFTRTTMKPYQLGYRALAANFSDLAAMGAYPSYYLISIVVPTEWKKTDVLEIFDGMSSLASEFNADLIGGDTVSGKELVLSVTAIGRVNRDKARFRNTAREGDLVFVTGTLGDSAAGLYILQEQVEAVAADYFIGRHQMPTPRVDFASGLDSIKRVTLNDISDGLANELHEIAEESRLTIIISDGEIPVHPHFHQFPNHLQRQWKYFGGEDFELVGTVSREDWPFVQAVAEKQNVSVNKIGYCIAQTEHPVYIKKFEKLMTLEKDGYRHLK